MRIIPFLAALLIIIFLSGCNKTGERMCDLSSLGNDTLNVTINKSAGNINTQVSISIDSVLNDSRCPLNVQCFWEGNAVVRFLLTNSDGDKKFVLNTHGGMNFPSDTLLDGYSIQLLKLSPYPESGKDILQSEYSADLLIIKQ